jgi:2-methylisocitrate lyase-like PEP mutase family enzyme
MGFNQAVERVAAAVEAARSLPFPFTLTARAENHFAGIADLDGTIRRLIAFQEAGADVLFAPGLAHRVDIAEVLKTIDRPVNVLIGVPGMSLNAWELLDMGVWRISVGGPLARAALGALVSAATGDHGLQRVGCAGLGVEQAIFRPGRQLRPEHWPSHGRTSDSA